MAYQGLETGNRDYACHVVRNGDVIFAFKSALNPEGSEEFGQHLQKHGDGVRDVAFHVDDARAIFEKAVSRGAKVVQHPKEMKDSSGGHVMIATVQTYGDTTHTFVERPEGLTDPFLPGFV